MKFYPKTKR